MRRFALLPVIFAVALLAPLARPGVTVAQDVERDRVEAAATAEELFRLAAERKFHALYDWIHPDAHAVVPRAAAVGAFEAVYEVAQAGRAEILDVQMGEWTWGVTGQAYPYSAFVFYRQPFIDENGEEAWLEETMNLVEHDGEWRWFFGKDPEFVADVIEQFGDAAGTPLTEGDLLQNVVDDLDAFWRDVFTYTEYEYVTPGVVLVEEGTGVGTACGPAQTGFWAFYCPPDQTVYLDEALLAQLERQADFAAAFVIAHEWAHHAQTGTEFVRVDPGEQPDEWNEVYSIELELMADCLSGAWALDVDTRGLLEPDDVDEAIRFTVEYLGDPGTVDAFDPQAHGTADQRAQAFLLGYEDGFSGCNITI
jgi:predicted metalloprotease